MAKDTVHTESGEALDVTEADIWAALDDYFAPVERLQPGDVTVRAMMERYHVGEKKAKKMMHAAEASGSYRLLKVPGPNGEMWVLRKIA